MKTTFGIGMAGLLLIAIVPTAQAVDVLCSRYESDRHLSDGTHIHDEQKTCKAQVLGPYGTVCTDTHEQHTQTTYPDGTSGGSSRHDEECTGLAGSLLGTVGDALNG